MRGRTATIAFGGFVILGLPTGMLGVAWPSIRGELDAPLAGLGLVLAAMTVTEFGSSALSGIVRERFGTTALLLLPTALAAGGLLLFTIAQSWSTVIVAAAVLGAGLGLLDAAVNTEAALRRGVRFMGALHASWAVGATLGPPLIGSPSWWPVRGGSGTRLPRSRSSPSRSGCISAVATLRPFRSTTTRRSPQAAPAGRRQPGASS